MTHSICKKIIIGCVFVFCTVMFAGQGWCGWKFWEDEKPQNKVPRIAIVSTDDQLSTRTNAQRVYALPSSMADRISYVLQESKRFKIVDRNVLQRTINEKLIQKGPEEGFVESMTSFFGMKSKYAIGDRVDIVLRGGKLRLFRACIMLV